MKDIQKHPIPIPKDPVQFIKTLSLHHDHEWLLTLIIGKSMSFRYKEIIILAELWPYHEIKDNMHYLSFKSNELDGFLKIYSMIRNWKSLYILVNGEYALTDKHYFELWLQCYIQKTMSQDKKFCYDSPIIYPESNTIGCHYLREVQKNINYWLRLGKTRETIISTLIGTAYKFRFCPELPVQNIEKLINLLENLSMKGD